MTQQKLKVRANKLTKYGMMIVEKVAEQGYRDNPYMIASITDIDVNMIIEFLDR